MDKSTPADNHCVSKLDLTGGIGNDPSVLVTCWSALAEFNLIRDPPHLCILPSFCQLDLKVVCLAKPSVRRMFSTMSPILLFITALSCGWLVWSLWHKASPAKRLPGIPLVEFDGDNSRERYTSDAASLLGKGYDMVEPFLAVSLQPCH